MTITEISITWLILGLIASASLTYGEIKRVGQLTVSDLMLSFLFFIFGPISLLVCFSVWMDDYDILNHKIYSNKKHKSNEPKKK